MPNMEDDPYECVAKAPLKLKGVETISKKNKKKEKKKKILVKGVKIVEEEDRSTGPQHTKAQLAFKKMLEKTVTERIMKKASLTHKQRVEAFNRDLDSLTEHFDIPKVSWTK